MNWVNSPLTWPSVAQSIQTDAETVTTEVGTIMDEATARLTPLISDANYTRHPLSVEAQALLGLRDDLDLLLTQGVVLTASPYQFQVGDQQASGAYLNPQQAVSCLAAKLRDQVDKNRPAGQLYCVAVMVSESQLNQFASVLNNLVSVFPLPDWGQVARQSTALSTQSVDKLFQPASISQPRFKPAGSLHASPLRETLYYQGAQVATLESLAHDKNHVIDKLQVLATKRASKLAEISEAVNALKNLTGSVWSMSLSGSTESIAAQLSQASAPGNNQHTIASLLLSAAPLTFFEELLCSA
ncbi:hypothetical protein [Psychromonas ossibalaenae]|uniref:hypothetical protein n=1 Tax=Psychromonas ossibalaenae TaxID=444922 RepID=UPI000371023F|nr:hypothetical protein [Psychromonas ossibalaenae]